MSGLKVGDRIIVSKSLDVEQYDVGFARGRKGKIIGTKALDKSSLAMWAKKIKGIQPDTILYYIKLDQYNDEIWVFDLHLVLDLDALPYDEWVKRRDWNKVYKDQSEKVLRG